MVKVEVRIKTSAGKAEKGWWAEVTPTIVGEGSSRRVGTKGDPRWLPRPQAGRDGALTAWVERPAGTFIRAGGDAIGGYRHARVASPVLIVEEGASWHGGARDGTRSVDVWVTNARPATEEDVVAAASAATEEGGGQKDAVAILQDALAALRAGQVREAEVAISEAIALLGMLAETGS